MKVLFTGGMGDFFTVEAHMTDAEKQSVQNILLATPAADYIRQALKMHIIWKDIPVVDVLTRSDLKKRNRTCVISLQDTNNIARAIGKRQITGQILDMSIMPVFAEIKAHRRKYNRTGMPLSPVKKDLVIDAATVSDYIPDKYPRNFSVAEIFRICKYAGNRDYVNVGVGETTLAEAISYVAGSSEFIGVDSAMSVIAAISSREIGKKKRIFVRSQNDHLMRNIACYYGNEPVQIGGEFTG